LSEAFAGEDLRGRLTEVVEQFDTRPVSDLMDLLAQVQLVEKFPKSHLGIQ